MAQDESLNATWRHADVGLEASAVPLRYFQLPFEANSVVPGPAAAACARQFPPTWLSKSGLTSSIE